MVKLMNLDMSDEILFDNKNYVLNSKSLGTANITLSTFQGFNQIGSKVSGRVVGERDIAIIGYIIAEDEEEMLEKKQGLQRVVGVLEDFYLVINDFKIRVSAKKSIEYATDYSENNKNLSKFKIEGTATEPYFTKINPTVIPIAHWLGNFHFPLSIVKDTKLQVMGIRQNSKIKMIENKGALDTGMKITFTCKVKSISNPYLLNIVTGEHILINCDLKLNDELVIDTNFGHKTVTLNGEENYLYKMDLDSDFLQLHPGENYLFYDAQMEQENGIEVSIEFSTKFLEV